MASQSSLWEWLNEAQSRGVQPGLERMERLLIALGNPEKNLQCLHVAGTNGKGSVCAFAESVLRASGQRTGFYSSPHLVDFAERIRIDGVPASQSQIEAGIQRLQEATREWSEEELPTYFELVTALAFDLFSRAACDIIVLETGLGGRLDATNTAPKIACAITPIALDHTEWLGESLAAIAREKAGIFRLQVPVVIAPQEEEAAEALRIAAWEVGAPVLWSLGELLLENMTLGLAGSHQRKNAALALDLLKTAGFHPSEEEIRKGLSSVVWPGRFQRLRGKWPRGELILDGAHNLHAVRQLVETWREEFGEQKCRLIFGALCDKDPGGMIVILESIAEEIFLVPVSSPRSLHPDCYHGMLQTPSRICGSLLEALNLAYEPHSASGITPSPPVLLAGSLFLVGEALALHSGAGFLSRSQ